MSSSEEKSASPVLPKDSDRGSSVSSDLQDEYEELLRYAVVTPKFEPSGLRQSDHMEVHQIPAGKSPGMSGYRHERAGVKWRCHGRTPELAASSRTTRIEVSAAVKESAHMDMEGLCPIRSEETCSPGSSSSQRDLQGTYVTDMSLSDDRVTHIESILDLWSGSLKTNVLTELRKWKLHFIEHHTLEMRQEREKHAADVRQLTNQMENLKELLHTYEISLGRKDEVIANLTHAIEKQKDRIELMKKFTKWRLQHFLGKQKAREELYANKLADRLYKLGLLRKAWAIWRSRFNAKWKEIMEKAVQTSVESMRATLTNEYEAKLQTVNSALEEARSEIIELQNQRQDYEDAMKKAFMRGVCALNLEAMSMFQGKDFKLDQVRSQLQPGPSVRSSIFRQQQEQVNSEVRSQPGLSTRSSMFRQQQEQLNDDVRNPLHPGPSTRSSMFRQQQEQVNGEVRNPLHPGPSNRPSMFHQQQEQENGEARNQLQPGPSVRSSIFQQQQQEQVVDGEARNQLHPVPSNRSIVFRQQQEQEDGEVRNPLHPVPSTRPNMFRQQQEQVNGEARNQLQPVPSVRSSIFQQQQEPVDGEVRSQLQPGPSARSNMFRQQQEQEDGKVVDLPEKRAESGAGTGGPTAKFSSFQPMPSTSSLPQPPPHFAPTTAGSAAAEDLFSSHQGHAVTSQTRLDSAAALTACGAATGSGTICISKLPTTRVVTSAQQKPGRTVTAKITGRSDFSAKNRICSNLDVLGVSPPMNSVVVEKHHPVTQQTISQAVAAKYPRTLHQSSNAIGVRHLGHNGKTPAQSHNNIQSIKVVE
ncbi:centrosomal protein POC5 isoform X1 [Pantherophis guttatus]|uniref:Centrosomal protein POC5 n=2 Tax=Pantherophis guttatus TaxID=94885 RepID=A0A6P9DMC6_PANGU|nr:centrosomal protein POC5 isoform X1 [Pantherophis guttatus]XP_034296997.1 centrosomal protein POC5 isoform X1 [Pantherophis guttatus]XP_034296998.1 centrosomal protein POC5 isoform X1 [Pantherophis guttatus]XP_034296999.1 centrosomal protein POC5 isoform X1 [Pantherophis guttatus]XP_034297000.1 centrosomal protein POC5 isoform X1 [Pantherophis guttatus]